MSKDFQRGWRNGGLRLKWTLASKIGGLVAVLLVLLLTVAVSSLLKLRGIGKEIEEIVAADVPIAKIITEIESHQLKQYLALERALRLSWQPGEDAKRKRDETFADFARHARWVDQKIEQGKKLAAAAPAATAKAAAEYRMLGELLTELGKKHQAFEDAGRTVIRLLRAGRLDAAERLGDEVTRQTEELDGYFVALVSEIESFTEESVKSAQAHEKAALRVGALLGFLALLIGIGVSAILIRRLTKPIVELSPQASPLTQEQVERQV